MSKKKKRLIIIGFILLISIILSAWGFLMQSVSYDIHSKKLPKGLKIVFLSDLHNCFYGGTDQSQLMDWIDEESPDIVIFGGDVLDGWGGQKYAKKIMTWSAEHYPTFYTPGNHEEMRDDKESFYDWVRGTDVQMLIGDHSDISIKGQKIRIYGIIDKNYGGDLDKIKGTLDDSFYNILIAHQPEQIDDYLDTGDVKFDLILSGHAHGGQWRLGKYGLIAPGQGLFPKYTSGMYDDRLIVSRGANSVNLIPRINNKPEVVIIRLEKNNG